MSDIYSFTHSSVCSFPHTSPIHTQADQERIRKLAAKGIVANHTDELLVPIDNRLEEEEDDFGFETATGLDAAIGTLSVSGDSGPSVSAKVRGRK